MGRTASASWRRGTSIRFVTMLGAITALSTSGALSPRPAPAAGLAHAAVLGWMPGVVRNVPVAAHLTVYFDRPMNGASVQRAWRMTPHVPGTFTGSATSVSFVPVHGLRPTSTYRLSIAASARSLSGVPLGAPYNVTFSTGDALRVLHIGPANNSHAVPMSGRISVTFNHPMVPLQGLSAPAASPHGWQVRIEPGVSGYGAWLGTSTWVFHPAAGLQPSTRYAISLPGSVRDAAGEALGRAVRWGFRTATPEIFSRSPDRRQSFVDPHTTISVTFNQLMDRSTTARAFTVTSNGARVGGSITWQGSKLIFHPAVALNSDHPYHVSVASTARSANRQATLNRSHAWHFSAAPPPRITSTEPREGGTAGDTGFHGGGYFGGQCCYHYHATIHFNTPMDKASLDRHLTVTPALGKMETWFGRTNRDDFAYTVAGDFRASSSYTITIAAGVKDMFGRTLAGSVTLHFRTSKLHPSVALFGQAGREGISFTAGQIVRAPMQLVNRPHVRLTLIHTTLDQLNSACCGAVPGGTVVRRWTETSPNGLNKVENIGARLTQREGTPLAPGLYWLHAAAPSTSPAWSDSAEIVAVTDVNLTLKSADNGLLVWANMAKTIEPVAGLKIHLTNAHGSDIVAGQVDAHGVHLFRSVRRDQYVYAAVVRGGSHFGIAQTNWQPDPRSPDSLTFPRYRYYGGAPQNGQYLYTDRPIYRPGQTVHFRALIWQDHDGVYGLMGGPARQVKVYATDNQGRRLYHATLTLDRFGGVHGSFPLRRGIQTGSDNILIVNQHGVSINANFTIAEYRKPEFLTTVRSVQPSYTEGQSVRAIATVRYVFGAPLRHGRVQWTAFSQTHPPEIAGWDSYSFFDWEGYWQQYMAGNPNDQANQSQFGTQLSSGTGTTNGNGNLTVSVPVPPVKNALDQTVTIEMTSSDLNNQSVSGRVVVPVYHSDLAIGLLADRETAPSGQAQTVHVVSVRHDGTPLAGQALTVTILKRTYSSKLTDVGNGQTQFQPVPHDAVVETHNVTANAAGKADISFTPREGGEYRISVTGKDSKGNSTTTAISIYSSAEGFSDWGSAGATSLILKPDKTTYNVGDTAHIAVPAPFSDATALVTTERGTIRSHRVLQLQGNSPVINVPVGLHDLPNIYVTVTLYHGWRGTVPPDWRYGVAALHVRVDPKHLLVHLTQNASRHHPRDTVTYTVTTTDAKGHPLPAQLSFALVDTSVLALQADSNADILKALYPERPLSVSTASDGTLSINQSQAKPDFQVQGNTVNVDTTHQAAARAQPGGGGGGGGGYFGPQATVRSHFNDTAYWTGALVTDSSGRGTLRVRLPDNTTTWRLDARGATLQQNVGQANIRTLASQDVVLRPALPRFLTQGDRLQIVTLLNNRLAHAVSARVSLSAPGLRVQSGASQTTQVPAHGERKIAWTATVPIGNTASILFRAVSLTPGVQGDAVRLSLPIHPPLTDETVATSGQVYSVIKQMVIVPAHAVSIRGALTVRVAASLTAGLGAAYGMFAPTSDESNEDVANRVLAAASLRSLPQSITGLSTSTYRRLPQVIAAGVQKLIDHQYSDGAWPWFTDPYRYEMEDPNISADALQAIVASGERSGTVRQAIGQAQGYLHRQLTDSHVSAAQAAHIIFVLAQSGGQPDGLARSLYSDSETRLHLEAAPLSDLGMALSIVHSPSATQSVIASLDGSAKVSATGAHWESSGWGFDGNGAIGATTEVLSMLVRTSPHDPFVPAAVRWLMLARQGDGWDSPHNSAQAIAALATYARAAREGTADYRYRVAVNNSPAFNGAYVGANQRQTHTVNVPLSHLRRGAANALIIQRQMQGGTLGSGPLYYLARLHYYLPADRIAPRSEGVSVSRRYLTLSGKPMLRMAAGAPLKVELTIHTDQTLLYLNVQDPIPAGCEPIDESLDTSQQGLAGPQQWTPWGTTQDLSWYLSHTDLHDNRVSLYAYSLPPGAYRFTYLARATVSGQYGVAPTHVSETFFPEVFGRSAGQVVTVR